MGYQTAPHSSLGLPCGLYQFMSLTEGTALLFESELVLYPHLRLPMHPPTPYRLNHITEAEKNSEKLAALIQVASRISYEMIAI